MAQPTSRKALSVDPLTRDAFVRSATDALDPQELERLARTLAVKSLSLGLMRPGGRYEIVFRTGPGTKLERVPKSEVALK